MTFKAYFKKEFIESMREHKIIIIFMSFFFFAISTPPLMKMLPDMLEAQYGAGMPELMKGSAIDAVANFLSSTVPQICVLVICLLLGGILCNEVSKGSIVFPITKGANKASIVIAKFSFYSLLIFIVTGIATLTNIYYSYGIYNEEFPTISAIAVCIIGVFLYLEFIVALVFFFSSIFKKSVGAALLAMGINVVLILFAALNYEFNPYSLITEGAKLTGEIPMLGVGITLLVIIGAFMGAIYIFSKREMDS